MTTHAFVADLLRRGVVLERRGSRLHIEAPAGALTNVDRETLQRLKEDLLALLDGRQSPADVVEGADALREAWRQACRELGEACGWPELTFRPGRAVAPGELMWRKFLVRSSVPDLVAVTVVLREWLAHEVTPPE